MGMVCKASRSSARTTQRRASLRRLIAMIVMVQWPVVLGHTPPIIFQYGGDDLGLEVPGFPNAPITEIETDMLDCFGGFQPQLFPGPAFEGAGNVSGRCVYDVPLNMHMKTMRAVPSFSTLFQINIVIDDLSGSVDVSGVLQGLAFIIGGEFSVDVGEAGGYLGWLDSTLSGTTMSHDFAVEVDFLQDEKFMDPPYVHVGVDYNSLISVKTNKTVGPLAVDYFSVTVWVEYSSVSQMLDVFITWSGPFGSAISELTKPASPILSTAIDLTETFSQEGMFVGISGSLNSLLNTSTSYFWIPVWTFNSDGPAPDVPRYADGRPIERWIIAARRGTEKTIRMFVFIVPYVMLFLLFVLVTRVLYRRHGSLPALDKKFDMEAAGEQNGGPQILKCGVVQGLRPSKPLLRCAGLSESVHRGPNLGLLNGSKSSTEIAVKRIPAYSKQGSDEILVDIKSNCEMEQSTLMRLLGWCHET